MEKTLTIFRFPDLSQWEWELVSPVIDAIRRRRPIEIFDVKKAHRGCLRRARRPEDRIYWVVASNWRDAVAYLAPSGKAAVFVSVLDMKIPRRALPMLVLYRLTARPLPECVKLITYSPLTYRFFNEIERIPEHRLFLSSLPVPPSMPAAPRGATEKVVIGTLAQFTADNNLHFFLNVAHYVAQRNPRAHFRIIGRGELLPHLKCIVRDLGLTDAVSFGDGKAFEELAGMDAFLYVPLRNDHFGQLLFAAAARLPVLTNEVPGIEALITDGVNGFVFPVNETRPMGELVLRLVESPGFGTLLGHKLAETLAERLSPERVANECDRIFFEPATQEMGRAVVVA